jgi:hypothetical protein
MWIPFFNLIELIFPINYIIFSKEAINMDEQSFLDQEIIRLRDKTKEHKRYTDELFSKIDIKTGRAMIDDHCIEFEERTLLNGKMKMVLPVNFQSVPPEQLFKPESKPDLVLIYEGGAIQILILNTQKEANNENDIIAHKNDVQQILQALNSSIEWLEGGEKVVSEGRIYFFEFITPMLGARIYNLSYFLNLENRVLMGSFVGSEEKTKYWKPVFYQMLDTIWVNPIDDSISELQVSRS